MKKRVLAGVLAFSMCLLMAQVGAQHDFDGQPNNQVDAQVQDGNIIVFDIPFQHLGTRIELPTLSSFAAGSLFAAVIGTPVIGKDEKEAKTSDKISMLANPEFSEVLESLNGFMIQILLILKIYNPMTMTNQQLVEICGCYQMKVIRSLNKLEDMGLIKRMTSLTDARIKGNYLTEEGLSLIENLSELMQ